MTWKFWARQDPCLKEAEAEADRIREKLRTARQEVDDSIKLMDQLLRGQSGDS